MILTNHILTGAVILLKVKYLPLAILLAFISHYILDIFPHIEYSITDIKRKRWKQTLDDFFRVFLDGAFGFLIIFIFTDNIKLAVLGGFIAALPDIFTFLNLLYPNKLLKKFSFIHSKVHFLAKKKIPVFWEILIQVIVFVIAAYFLIN